MAYYLLTGKPLFTGRTVVEVLAQLLHEHPEPPSVRAGRDLPADLERLVLQCLDEDPAQRPDGALALRDALDGLDVGRWSETDARAWWRTRAPEVRARRKRDTASDGAATGSTLAIDLDRRGRVRAGAHL